MKYKWRKIFWMLFGLIFDFAANPNSAFFLWAFIPFSVSFVFVLLSVQSTLFLRKTQISDDVIKLMTRYWKITSKQHLLASNYVYINHSNWQARQDFQRFI